MGSILPAGEGKCRKLAIEIELECLLGPEVEGRVRQRVCCCGRSWRRRRSRRNGEFAEIDLEQLFQRVCFGSAVIDQLLNVCGGEWRDRPLAVGDTARPPGPSMSVAARRRRQRA